MYVHIKGMIPSSNSCILPYQPCAKLAHHDKDIGMRIAVIEDNEALAQGIAFRLRDRGHAVDLLHDGHEADAFLSREGADLVVLDLNLPGMDGIDILRALRRRGDGTPVILLTKPDLCADPTPYVEQAESISSRVPVVLLNAKSDSAKDQLAPWCKPGDTLVFLGTSGVGKSTLVNALFGRDTAETAEIREDDARGRHTTRHRQMRFLPNGCAVMDTPGMRELQMAEAEGGIADLFQDLTALASQCKFRNCSHQSEPGCALTAALAKGEITQARFERWIKLSAEERYNTASLSERKGSDKVLHKTIRSVQKRNRKTRR